MPRPRTAGFGILKFSTSDYSERTATTNDHRIPPYTTNTDTMGSVNVEASQWRLVEVGRVVLFVSGEHQGKLGAIAEIIDHKRVRSP